MLTEISGVEEPPTDFTDAHRWLGYVGLSHGIHRIHSKLGCVRGALGTAWVRQDAIPSYICVNPCYLWENTVCFVGAAETAAPPELASVGGNFKNVGAWVWQDAIPSYKTSVLICAICGRLFSARRFCAFRAFCGRIPFALLVQQRLLHPLSLHLWEAISRMWVRGYGRMPYPPMTLRLAVLGDSLLDEHFELLAEFGVVLQQSLCSVATLRQFRAVVAVPRARLLDDAVLYAEVYHLANL